MAEPSSSLESLKTWDDKANEGEQEPQTMTVTPPASGDASDAVSSSGSPEGEAETTLSQNYGCSLDPAEVTQQRDLPRCLVGVTTPWNTDHKKPLCQFSAGKSG